MKKMMGFALWMAVGLLVLQGPCQAAIDGYYIGADSRQALEQAREANPDNYAVNYFLGQIYLAEGNRDAAISAWQAYLAAAPSDGKSAAVNERLTVLKMEQAREFAKKTLAEGGAVRLPADTIAVTDFKNLGTDKLVPYIKGLTAMIISDLSKVPKVRVLERAKIQALSQEMQLGLASGLVDQKSAPRVGRLLQARNVAWGEMGAPGGNNLEITSIVTEIVENTQLKETQAKGAMSRFFELQKELVFGILQGMGIEKTDLPDNVRKAVEKVHTTSVEALVQFGLGVDFLDNKDFGQAKQAFAKAATIDPDFDLAANAEAATPISDIPVTSDGATEEVSMSTAGSGEAGDEEATDERTGDEETADSGTGDDAGLATGDDTTTSTAVLVSSDTSTVTDTTTDATQQIVTTETETPYPTKDIGFAVGMVDYVYPASSKGYASTYLTTSPQNGSYTNVSLNRLESSSPYPTSMEINGSGDVPLVTFYGTTQNYPLKETEIDHNAYVVWGRFAETGTSANMVYGSTEYKIDTSGYYVGGDIMTMDNFHENPMTGTATYAGTAYGSYWTESEGANMTGTFSTAIDFSTGHVENFKWQVAGNGHSASIVGASGMLSYNADGNMFVIDPPSGTWSIDATTLNSGSHAMDARGAVYGTGAQAVGGIVGMSTGVSSTDVHVNGVFEGTK